MKRRILFALPLFVFFLISSLSVRGFIPGDADGDGVPDSLDLCPAENAAPFDRNGDGCIDPFTGARHVEYWGAEDTLITYVINETGAPNVSDGSDMAAIAAAFAAWTAIPGTEINFAGDGTVTQKNASAIDGVNLVTFVDGQFAFPNAVIAVGVATTFTADTLIAGRLYRAGEIFDADMIFNPAKTFRTPSGGGPVGIDIGSVAMHEAGHVFGLSHSAVKTSSMHYVLPAGLNATSLESDDELTFLKAYPDSATIIGASILRGTVTNGSTQLPVPGAIVFAINAASGDTAACDYTLPDGSYLFAGLPDGGYYVSIYPLNGTSPINFIRASNINELVNSTAETVFVPEFWDVAESATDVSADQDAIAVSAATTATADLVTNIDNVPPVVVDNNPLDSATNVAIDAAFVIEFSEAIDTGTLGASFSMVRLSDGAGVGGNITVLKDDSLIVFAPTGPLTFSDNYNLTLSTALTDRFGNALAAPFVVSLATEAEPPVSISSLAPNKGVVNGTVVISGAGFDTTPFPGVTFGTEVATVLSADPGRLVVRVPVTATTSLVTVRNADLSISNSLTFTVLSDVEVARGFSVGQAVLTANPQDIEVVPDGSYAYVATAAGVEAVVVDAAFPNYLSTTPIMFAGGTDGVAATPDGRRVYGVSRIAQALVEVNSDASSGALFNTILATRPIGAEPLGIVADRSGRRAYVATDEAEIQVWDVKISSATYRQQIATFPAPTGATLQGAMAITADGGQLLALDDGGDVIVYDIDADSLLTAFFAGAEPRGIVVDPVGNRAYVNHGTGDVSVIGTGAALGKLADISTGGSLRGSSITPSGNFAYVANFELDQLDVIDLSDPTAPTYRTVVTNVPMATDPIDAAMSPDAQFVFSILSSGSGTTGTQSRLEVTAIGFGPTIQSVLPTAGRVGSLVKITGIDVGFGGGGVSVDFNGVETQARNDLGGSVVVEVPQGATTGPLKVLVADDRGLLESNEVLFTVLGPSGSGGMRFAEGIAPLNFTLTDEIVIHPRGSHAFAGGTNGEFFTYIVDPAAPGFHSPPGVTQVMSTEISDMDIMPDGKSMFMVSGGTQGVPVVNTDPFAFDFTKGRDPVDFGSFSIFQPVLVACSPDNSTVLVYDNEVSTISIIDATGVADGSIATVVTQRSVSGFSINDIVFNPSGLQAYLAAGPATVLVMDTDQTSPTFSFFVNIEPVLQILGSEFIGTLAPSPDGTILYATHIDPVTFTRRMVQLRIPDGSVAPPDTIQVLSNENIGTEAGPVFFDQVRISPRADRGIYSIIDAGHRFWDLAEFAAEPISQIGATETTQPVEGAFTPDGSRFYVVNTLLNELSVYDFTTAQALFKVSGDNQNGVAGELLTAPLRVRVQSTAGVALGGVVLKFTADAGNGAVGVNGSFSNVRSVATDSDGFAEVQWILDSGTIGTQVVSVQGPSFQVFSATAGLDPSTIPLTLAEVLPLSGTTDVSVTTATQVAFSRAVDPASISGTTVSLHVQGNATPLPVVYGFSDSNRRVSMTPTADLNYATTYEIQVTTGVLDDAGGPLDVPTTTTFSTRTLPPLALGSISPPAATALVTVTIAGAGFDPVPANNTVNFPGVAAVPVASSGADFVSVKVPIGAATGQVTVTSGVVTSNGIEFNVLVPQLTTVDDVVGNVSTGSNSKSMVVTPDGALVYSVSPDGDVVVPVLVDSLQTLPSVQVGDEPVAIVMHPQGTVTYVANKGSASVSVIDVDASSPNFNKVLATTIVGANPSDLAISPTGDRVYVVNVGANTISVIDSDNSSATYNAVVGNVSTGSNTKSVAVTPDGGLIYVGTDTGFIVLEALNYGVVGNVSTGSNSKSMTVTPDGGLLFILTEAGDVLIVDIDTASSSFNEVVGNVSTGSNTKSMTVTPDGGLVYLVQEDSDQVIVVAVNVVGSVSVLEEATELPATKVQVAFIDTLETGNNPSHVVFDPRGNGNFLVSEPGDQTITLYGTVTPSIIAEILVKPRTVLIPTEINQCDKDDDDWWDQWHGRYIRGWIELPAEYDAHDIDIATVRLNDVIPGALRFIPFGDRDMDGLVEMRVKFDRDLFQEIIPQGDAVPVKITGQLTTGEAFVGRDTIRTLRPTILSPSEGQMLVAGAMTTIYWESPEGVHVDFVDVHYTCNDGADWFPVVEGVPDIGSAVWTVPMHLADSCRVMVTLYKDYHKLCFAIGAGMSDVFTITIPLSVHLAAFDVAPQDGSAVLRWQTSMEEGVEGFRLHRATSENGIYREVTSDPVLAANDPHGAAYEYRDETIRPNVTYYYKLEEIAQTGSGQIFGPFEFVFHAAFDLQQNVPNPFNPTTTIAFTIAEDVDVGLHVYDVAGRLVRTLVSGRQQAKFYKIEWDGTNDGGQRVSSGVYFYRLRAGAFVKTRKMLLLK